MKLALGTLISCLGAMTLLAGQGAQAPSQKEIDQAIQKGADYLRTAPSPGGHLNSNCDELILLTLIHAGVSEKGYKSLLEKCLSAPLEYTYKVSLLAMCLEELDATRYQKALARCAQFLVDNQASNGQWSYGKPTEYKDLPAADLPQAVPTGPEKKKSSVRDFGEVRERRKPKTWISVRQNRTVGQSGDNSNSQYAALGLRACFDANIRLPEDVLLKARTWWVESQHPDEGGQSALGKDAVSTGGEAPVPVRGWNYKKKGEAEASATLPMTAGAVGATVIYEYLLGRDWRKDPVTRAGVAWIGRHFRIHENYYYLYALERAGMLTGLETFEGRNWYWEGARFLVDRQKPDGSWGNREIKDQNTWDTCFAVLFLKKATRGIATEGAGSRK